MRRSDASRRNRRRRERVLSSQTRSPARGLGRHASAALLASVAFALISCSEAERRADRISELRKGAERGLGAVERFCQEREAVLGRFSESQSGWERALEEVLRASDPLNDYCESDPSHAHDHDLEGGFRRPPPDTLSP